MIAAYTPSTAAWTDGIWEKGKMIVMVPGTQTGGPEYRLLDHLGSLVIGTTSTGSVYDSDSYLPFGQLTASSPADPLLYTGLEKDAENNTYHAWFRNLSIAQARWLRPDPYLGSYNLANPQSFNRYAYVGNNPLAFIDPDGTSDQMCGSPCVVYSGPGPSLPPTSPSDTPPGASAGGPNGPGAGGSGGAGSGASANGQQPSSNPSKPATPQQPQKSSCPPGTRAAGAVQAAEGTGDALTAYNLAALHFVAAALLFSAGCLEPTPAEPVTCGASLFGVGSLSVGGVVLGGLGTTELKNEVIPGIKQAITCVPSGG